MVNRSFPDLRSQNRASEHQPVAPSDFIVKFLFLLIKKANLYLLPVCSPAPEIEISVFTIHQFLLEVKLRCPSGLFNRRFRSFIPEKLFSRRKDTKMPTVFPVFRKSERPVIFSPFKFSGFPKTSRLCTPRLPLGQGSFPFLSRKTTTSHSRKADLPEE